MKSRYSPVLIQLTKARLAPCAQALGLDNAVKHPLVHYYIQLDQVLDEVEQCDIVHFHIGYLHFPPFNRQSVPHITTVYDRLDIDDLDRCTKGMEKFLWCRFPTISAGLCPALIGRGS